jgi:dihydrofolate reductase
MSDSSRVRVYMACSFDGFIAGPDDDLGWLHQDHTAVGDLAPDPEALGFDAFMGQVGAMLMGRATYDAVTRIGQWIYGETPVLVATHRPLEAMAETVQPAAGSIEDLVRRAKQLADDRDVYLDGGSLIQQAINAGLVDEITATFVPILLAEGTRLFDGLVSRTSLQFVSHHAFEGGMVQVTARVRRDIASRDTA